MRRYAIIVGGQSREKATTCTDHDRIPPPAPSPAPAPPAPFSGGTGTEAEFGSLGALSPTWWEPEDGSEPEPWLTPDQAFERFFEWTSDRGIELWDHQEEALMDLAAGDHVILGTPTGSGKSLVALGMLFMGMAQGKRCYYTAPIKALVSEKFFDLVQVLGRDNVGMITRGHAYQHQGTHHLLHGRDPLPTTHCARAKMPTWAAWPWTSSTTLPTPTAVGLGRCRCSPCPTRNSCS